MADGEPQRQYFDIAPSAGKKPSAPELKTEDKSVIEPPEEIANNRSFANTTPTLDDETSFQVDTLMDPAEANENETGEISNAGFIITPVPEKNEQSQSSEDSERALTPSDDESDKVDKLASIGQFETVPDEQPIALSREVKTSVADKAGGETIEVTKASQPEEVSTADTGPEDSVTGSGGLDNQESVDKDVPMSEEQFATANITEDPGKKAAETAKAEMQEPKIYDTKEYYVPIGRAHHKHGGLKGPFVFGIICAIIVVAVALYVMYSLGK